MEVRRANYQSPGEAGKRGFEDLDTYKLALDIVVNVHQLAQTLPAEEKYEMASQIRRSSKGVTANIAEAYGRYHYLDSLHYYSIARGELNETLSHFINALVLGYIKQDYFDEIYKLIRKTESALNGFMTYIRKHRVGSQEDGAKVIREENAYYETFEEGRNAVVE
ncbi:MAG: hypothetical protein Fur0022_15420 [Anaerolineales bacterium]